MRKALFSLCLLATFCFTAFPQTANVFVKLTWPTTSGAVTYNLYKSATPGGTYTLLSSALTAPAFTDSIAPGTSAYYEVSAVNSSGVEGSKGAELAISVAPIVAQQIVSATVPAAGGSGGGGPPPVPLTISGGITASVTTSSATIVWRTNVVGDSKVGYSASPSTSYTFTPCCDPTNTTEHSVTINGLNPGTTYNFIVESTGGTPSAAVDSAKQQFSTLAVAANFAISGVGVNGVSETGAVFTWTTNAPATSRVGYAIAPSTGYTFTALDSTNVTSHSVVATSLSPGVLYNFVVESTGGTPSSTIDSPVSQFSTLNFTVANVAVSGISQTAAVFNWNTSAASTSSVGYAVAPSTTYTFSPVNSTPTLNHSVVVVGLAEGTTYNFVVESTGGSPVTAVDSSVSQFSTLPTSGGGGPPVLTVTAISSQNITSSGATLVWTTNNAADSQVGYAIAPSTSYTFTTLDSTKVTAHSVNLSGLSSNSLYNFVVKSNDGTTTITSANGTFSTPQQVVVLTISGVSSSGITQSGATITWTTNVVGDSQVGYAISPSTSYIFTPCCAPTNTTAHSVTLTNLNANSTYNFVVQSVGGTPSGTVVSAKNQFTTLASSGGTVTTNSLLMSMDLGVNSINDSSKFPAIPFGSLRPSDPNIQWQAMEPSRGNFNFGRLNQWAALAKSHGQTLLFTFGHTPSWAGASVSSAPNDVNSGDNYWKEFVTAVVRNAVAQCNAGQGCIQFYEVWNEADHGFYTGPIPDMVTMAKDALAIIHAQDPKAVVIGPSISSCCGTGNAFTWLKNYAAAGGLAVNAMDALSIHSYPCCGENLSPLYLDTAFKNEVPNLIAQYGRTGMKVYITEGAFNGSHGTSKTEAQQVAFAIQQYIYFWNSNIVNAYYWFQWDNTTFGTMYQNGQILPLGIAYQQFYSWVVGTTHTSVPNAACAVNGTVYSCSLTAANGFPELIVFDVGTNGSTFTIPAGFAHYQTLDTSAAHNISGNTININTTPIMLTK